MPTQSVRRDTRKSGDKFSGCTENPALSFQTKDLQKLPCPGCEKGERCCLLATGDKDPPGRKMLTDAQHQGVLPTPVVSLGQACRRPGYPALGPGSLVPQRLLFVTEPRQEAGHAAQSPESIFPREKNMSNSLPQRKSLPRVAILKSLPPWSLQAQMGRAGSGGGGALSVPPHRLLCWGLIYGVHIPAPPASHLKNKGHCELLRFELVKIFIKTHCLDLCSSTLKFTYFLLELCGL